MNHIFEQFLAQKWLLRNWDDVTTLLAVSGGPDSMALLRAMVRLRNPSAAGSLVVVHFNHRLRGVESDDDEMFVREQASRMGCGCIVARADENPPEPFSEEDARRKRYEFFCRTAMKSGARYVVTAHTADDQAETILLRILRGTGLDGLAGIPFSRQLAHGVSLIRPLLDCTRTEVLQYLAAMDQPIRHDSSNADARFTRNRVRNELIPQLERDYNPRIKDSLLRLGKMAAESQSVVAETVRGLHERCVIKIGPEAATINGEALAGINSYLVQQLLIGVWRDCGWRLGDMTWEHWRQLAALASGSGQEPRVSEFPGKIRATRQGQLLELTAPTSG